MPPPLGWGSNLELCSCQITSYNPSPWVILCVTYFRHDSDDSNEPQVLFMVFCLLAYFKSLTTHWNLIGQIFQAYQDEMFILREGYSCCLICILYVFVVYMHVCMCICGHMCFQVCMCACVCVCVCICVCLGQILMLDIFIVFLIHWGKGSVSAWVYRGLLHSCSMGARDLNSRLSACTASPLPTEPSSQTP